MKTRNEMTAKRSINKFEVFTIVLAGHKIRQKDKKDNKMDQRQECM